MKRIDVLTVTDFRLPGGTSRSTAQELSIQKDLGMTTGLLQANSRLSSRAIPWSSIITREIAHDQVVPLIPGDHVHARLAILRHPTALLAMPDVSRSLRVDNAVIVANQPAVKPNGDPEYDIKEVTAVVESRLGITPEWAPIGPVVRESLEPFAGDARILSYDWTNVFAYSGEPVARTKFDTHRPQIGRHSRPQRAKWPASRADIESAYPVSGPYVVRILGGAKPALDIIPSTPSNWLIHEFGELEPMRFLAEVDFWVYFHHPAWSEAYGRAIMEALWSGCVVILPEYLRSTYGDAAVYCEPAEVTAVIDEFCVGGRDYLLQSRVGQRFAARHSADLHKTRLRSLMREAVVSRNGEQTPSCNSVGGRAIIPRRPQLNTTRSIRVDRFSSSSRPRALLVTSNGAGMGHLTRLLGLARAAAKDFDPIFFSMSQGLEVVGAAGFPYEYVPFNSALQTRSELWHRYFEERLRVAVRAYNIDAIIFDGTWPYRGMLNVLKSTKLLRVWVRRAMWKPTISNEQLARAPEFDLIIEPGEHAGEYDVGATSQDSKSVGVSPMTVLSQSEVLSRAEALAELGLVDDPEHRYALVTLGAGNINDLRTTQERVLSAISQYKGWHPVLTKGAISSSQTSASFMTIETFPLARYVHAFDFVVAAAGYNSFAELMASGVPAIWIPNMSTMTDDQDARARWAHDCGVGLRALESDPESIDEAVALMCEGRVRASIQSRLDGLDKTNGAYEAASLISDAWRAHWAGGQRSHGG